MVAPRHVRLLGPPNDPPLVDPEPAYALRGAHSGRSVFILCPGPSFDLFPRDALDRAVTVGVNSIAEVYRSTYWIFNEPKLIRFFWRRIIKTGDVRSIVTENPNAWIAPWLPAGTKIYWYEYQVPIKRRIRGADPWWLWPDRSFLPGHCTVTANAISFAEMVGAKRIVLVGCDQSVYPGGQYYCEGVELNPGPWHPQGAIQAGKEWIESALHARKLWRTPISQVEPSCALKVPQVERSEALKWIEEEREK